MLTNIVPVIFALGSLVYGFLMFDRLVTLQYGKHRSAWYLDGCPTGFFCTPPETSWRGGASARERLSLVWLFVTPEWARHCDDASHILHHMRVAVFGWNFIVVVFFFSSGLASRLF